MKKLRSNIGQAARNELLRSMLEDRRREIQDTLRSLRVPSVAETGADFEEQGITELVNQVNVVLMQMKSDTLRKIDGALRRLEAGAYGFCVECVEEISSARLKALPFAALCFECAESEEESSAQRGSLRRHTRSSLGGQFAGNAESEESAPLARRDRPRCGARPSEFWPAR